MSIKKAAPHQENGLSNLKQDNNNKQLGKLDSMLSYFAQGRHLHRFQAERIGDHCLPTTISDLQIKHGVTFDRKFVKVPNRFGTETSVMSYWLNDDNLIKARSILEWSKAA